MSGTAQGIPQRLTAFVDPKTGLVSDTWWRFLQTLWQRTGGAQATSTTDDIIQFLNMLDVPPAPAPEPSAWLGAALGDVVPQPTPEPAAWLSAALADVPSPFPLEDAAWQAAAAADVVVPMPEPAALLAAAMADVPRVPETDPGLVALMVA